MFSPCQALISCMLLGNFDCHSVSFVSSRVYSRVQKLPFLPQESQGSVDDEVQSDATCQPLHCNQLKIHLSNIISHLSWELLPKQKKCKPIIWSQGTCD